MIPSRNSRMHVVRCVKERPKPIAATAEDLASIRIQTRTRSYLSSIHSSLAKLPNIPILSPLLVMTIPALLRIRWGGDLICRLNLFQKLEFFFLYLKQPHYPYDPESYSGILLRIPFCRNHGKANWNPLNDQSPVFGRVLNTRLLRQEADNPSLSMLEILYRGYRICLYRNFKR